MDHHGITQQEPQLKKKDLNTTQHRPRLFWAALVLFLLAPFVGEYLLGNLPLNLFHLFPVLALFYGGGAVLIREVVRRTGRGWPSIFFLAIAYGLLEESIGTQSLFNPNYLGLGLLEYGYIPALGIAGPWTAHVLSLHVAWSICIPIALTELLFSDQRTSPWLGNVGLAIVSVLFLAGLGLMTIGSAIQYGSAITPVQIGVIVFLLLLLIIGAFTLFRPASSDPAVPTEQDRKPLSPWLLGSAAFLSGSMLYIMNTFAIDFLPAFVMVLCTLLLDSVILTLILSSSRLPGWSEKHRFALAAGGLLVYCWWGFILVSLIYGTANIPGQVLWLVLALLLLIATRYRLVKRLEAAKT